MKRSQRHCFIITTILLVIVLIPSGTYFWGNYYLDTIMPYYVDKIQTSANPHKIKVEANPHEIKVEANPHEIKVEANPHEITIVTMYLNIGPFQKWKYFTPALYKQWMTTWGWLTNRVVAFFDNDEDLETFRKIRSVQPADRTVLIKLQRTEIPAFHKLEKIRTIYKNASYPKQNPNTVYAEYSCAMNAKYDVLQMAVQRGLVHTEYMAWLDIGLFRNLLQPELHPKDDRFTLEVPDNFNSSTVGMSVVTPWNELSKVSPWEYIRDNRVWVSGAFALATKTVMMKFAQSYTLMANELIDKGMSSTDQTVIGAMYSPEYIKRQPVDIVEYKCHDGQFGLYRTDIIYFCLGHICKDAAEKRKNEHTHSFTKNVKHK